MDRGIYKSEKFFTNFFVAGPVELRGKGVKAVGNSCSLSMAFTSVSRSEISTNP